MSNLTDILGTPEYSVDVQFSNLNFLARGQITDADRLAYLRLFQRIPAGSTDPKLVVTEIPAFIQDLIAHDGVLTDPGAIYIPDDLLDLLNILLTQVDSGNVTTAMVQKVDALILSLMAGGVIKQPTFNSSTGLYSVQFTDAITGGATPASIVQKSRSLVTALEKWIDIPQTITTVLDAVDAGEKAKLSGVTEAFEVEPSSLQQLIRLEYIQHAHDLLADALAGLHDDLEKVDTITALLNDLQDILNQKSVEDRVTADKLLELYGFKTDSTIYTASIQEYAKKVANWEDEVFNPANGLGRISDDLGSDSSGFIQEYNQQFTSNFIPVTDVRPGGIDFRQPIQGTITTSGGFIAREILPLVPIQPGSMRISVDGLAVDDVGAPITLIFSDNGIGGFVDTSGILGAGSKVNYATGEISIEFLSVNPVNLPNILINANYNFAKSFQVTDEALGSSESVDSVEFYLNGIPIIPGSVTVSESSINKNIRNEDVGASLGIANLTLINLDQDIITPGSIRMYLLDDSGEVLTTYLDNGDGTITVNPDLPDGSANKAVIGTLGDPIINYSTGLIGGGTTTIPTFLPGGSGLLPGYKIVADYEYLSTGRTLQDNGEGRLIGSIPDTPGEKNTALSNTFNSVFNFDPVLLNQDDIELLLKTSASVNPVKIFVDENNELYNQKQVSNLEVYNSDDTNDTNSFGGFFGFERTIDYARINVSDSLGLGINGTQIIPGTLVLSSNEGHTWTDTGDSDGDGIGAFVITTSGIIDYSGRPPSYNGTVVGSINYRTGAVELVWPNGTTIERNFFGNTNSVVVNADFLRKGADVQGFIDDTNGRVTIRTIPNQAPLSTIESLTASNLTGGLDGTIDYKTGLVSIKSNSTFPPDYQVTYSPFTTTTSVTDEVAAVGDGLTSNYIDVHLDNNLVVPGSLVLTTLSETFVDNGEGNFNTRLFSQAAGNVVISQEVLNAYNAGASQRITGALPSIGTSQFIPNSIILNFVAQGSTVETLVDDGLGNLYRTTVNANGTRDKVGFVDYLTGNYTLNLVPVRTNGVVTSTPIFPNGSQILASYEFTAPRVTDTFNYNGVSTPPDFTYTPSMDLYEVTLTKPPIDSGSVQIYSGTPTSINIPFFTSFDTASNSVIYTLTNVVPGTIKGKYLTGGANYSKIEVNFFDRNGELIGSNGLVVGTVDYVTGKVTIPRPPTYFGGFPNPTPPPNFLNIIPLTYVSGTLVLNDDEEGNLSSFNIGTLGQTNGTVNNSLLFPPDLVPGSIKIAVVLDENGDPIETVIDDGLGNLIGADTNLNYTSFKSETISTDFVPSGATTEYINEDTIYTTKLGQEATPPNSLPIVPSYLAFDFSDFNLGVESLGILITPSDFSVPQTSGNSTFYQGIAGPRYIVDNGNGGLTEGVAHIGETLVVRPGGYDGISGGFGGLGPSSIITEAELRKFYFRYSVDDLGRTIPQAAIGGKSSGSLGLSVVDNDDVVPIVPGSFLMAVNGGAKGSGTGLDLGFDASEELPPGQFFDSDAPKNINGTAIATGDDELFYSSKKQFILGNSYPIAELRGQVVEGLIRFSDGATQDENGNPFFVVVGDAGDNTGAAYMSLRADLNLNSDDWFDDSITSPRSLSVASYLTLDPPVITESGGIFGGGGTTITPVRLEDAGTIDYETGEYTFSFRVQKNSQDLAVAYNFGAGSSARKVVGAIDYETGVATFTTPIETKTGETYAVQYNTNSITLPQSITHEDFSGQTVTFNLNKWNVPFYPGSVVFTVAGQRFRDDSNGTLVSEEDPTVTLGYINYTTGVFTRALDSVTFTEPVYTAVNTYLGLPSTPTPDPVTISLSIPIGSVDYTTGAVKFHNASAITNDINVDYTQSVGSIDYVNGTFTIRLKNPLGFNEEVLADYVYVNPFEIKNEAAFPPGTGVGPVSYTTKAHPLTPGSVSLKSGERDFYSQIVGQGTGQLETDRFFVVEPAPLYPGSVEVHAFNSTGTPFTLTDIQSSTDPSIGEFYDSSNQLVGTVEYLSGILTLTMNNQLGTDISVEYHRAFNETVGLGTGDPDQTLAFFTVNKPLSPETLLFSGIDTNDEPFFAFDVKDINDSNIGNIYDGFQHIDNLQIGIGTGTSSGGGSTAFSYTLTPDPTYIRPGSIQITAINPYDSTTMTVYDVPPATGDQGELFIGNNKVGDVWYSEGRVEIEFAYNATDYPPKAGEPVLLSFDALGAKIGSINYTTGLASLQKGLKLDSELKLFYPSNFNQLIVEDIVDDGNGNLSGTGIASGTVNYRTGEISVTFTSAVTASQRVTINYENYQFPVERVQTFVMTNPGGNSNFSGQINSSLLPVDLKTLSISDGGYKMLATDASGNFVPVPGDTSGNQFKLYRTTTDFRGRVTTNSVGTIDISTGRWTLSLPYVPAENFQLVASFTQLPPSFISDEDKINNALVFNGTLSPAGGLGGNIRVTPGSVRIDTQFASVQTPSGGYVFTDPDGDGILTARFNGSLVVPGTNILVGGGTIDYTTGKYQLQFFKDPPPGIQFKADYEYSAAGGLPSNANQLLRHLRARVQQAINSVAGESDIKNRLEQILIDLNSVSTLDEFITDQQSGQTDEFQRHLSTAIVSVQSLNDTKKEELREKLFTYEEYIKSASALIAKISQILEKIASNISR